MNLQEFTAKYANTVHIDTKTQETYIRIPVTDLGELSFMQHTLLENLNLLSQLNDDLETNRDMKDCMFWISKILLASYPSDELEGIAKLIQSASKLM
ncbi:hypothetical protein [Aquimarina sp. RZ0]|uniref:hypothetical protein n=1 Tax=Aquimarina sp. RZ0 TaxID=2607730 RepID=UPI0011F2F9AD|nr:hypothetical protein [Aquimarina sp. RZ0]KAA1246521.1 hypothetical protein F0000_07100 [Aquimarina sp. RZ0]